MNDETTTWRKRILQAKEKAKDTTNLLSVVGDVDSEFTEEFDNNGFEKPFTAWSEARVYFPICYDGSQWVGSVSRHPDDKPTWPQGGG